MTSMSRLIAEADQWAVAGDWLPDSDRTVDIDMTIHL